MKIGCAQCGQELDRPPSRVRANAHQFCDRRCLAAFQSRQVEVVCVQCGTRFTLAASRAAQNDVKVCSDACLREYRRQVQLRRWDSAEQRESTCAQCGKAITRKPNQLARYPVHFCSRACKASYQAGPHPEQVTGRWVQCEGCGIDVWRTPATERAHIFCSRKCAGGLARSRPGPGLAGPKNPNWHGGASLLPYAIGFTRTLSRKIRERDDNACRLCGEPWRPKSGNLAAHHRDEGKGNHEDANLVTLCRSCHNRVHAGKVAPPA